MCAPGRTRTCDPLLRRQLLYPTELRAPGTTLCMPKVTCRPRAGSLCVAVRGRAIPTRHSGWPGVPHRREAWPGHGPDANSVPGSFQHLTLPRDAQTRRNASPEPAGPPSPAPVLRARYPVPATPADAEHPRGGALIRALPIRAGAPIWRIRRLAHGDRNCVPGNSVRQLESLNVLIRSRPL